MDRLIVKSVWRSGFCRTASSVTSTDDFFLSINQILPSLLHGHRVIHIPAKQWQPLNYTTTVQLDNSTVVTVNQQTTSDTDGDGDPDIIGYDITWRIALVTLCTMVIYTYTCCKFFRLFFSPFDNTSRGGNFCWDSFVRFFLNFFRDFATSSPDRPALERMD